MKEFGVLDRLKKEELKYLIELADDEQWEVRSEIIRQLKNYGYDLEIDLEEFSSLLDEKRKLVIEPILGENRRKQLKEDWSLIPYINSGKSSLSGSFQSDFDYPKLEYALRLIAKYQSGGEAFIKTDTLLDELAEEFNAYYPFGDEVDLAKYLFNQKGFFGEKNDYYNPFNSNIFYVIKERRGIPISLCSLYMLVGYRLNMSIEGCNFPGHFLAKINIEGDLMMVDCFNGGKVIHPEDFEGIKKISGETAYALVHRKTSVTSIIKRTLKNLENAYAQKKDEQNRELFRILLTYNF